MNQQQNTISLARVINRAVSLVGDTKIWNLVKHRLGQKWAKNWSILRLSTMNQPCLQAFLIVSIGQFSLMSCSGTGKQFSNLRETQLGRSYCGIIRTKYINDLSILAVIDKRQSVSYVYPSLYPNKGTNACLIDDALVLPSKIPYGNEQNLHPADTFSYQGKNIKIFNRNGGLFASIWLENHLSEYEVELSPCETYYKDIEPILTKIPNCTMPE